VNLVAMWRDGRVMTSSRLEWYAKRLRGMSPAEIAWRIQSRALQEAWSRRRFGPATSPPPPASSASRHPESDADAPLARSSRSGVLFPRAIDLTKVPEQSKNALIAAALEILSGRFEVLGVLREDMADPDWSLDPISGRSYPTDRSATRIDYRSGTDPRNVKHVWELSRHHHLTLLAYAWRLTGDDRFASMAASNLLSWWERNPVFMGVNWSSGIEIGIRLISWVWTRRLLDGWPEIAGLFEKNETAVHQVYWHQRFLASFSSRGSSANNHAIAEAAGQLVTSCAFPWFAETSEWRVGAVRLLERELAHNTFPDGVDREQAFDYHGLVAELGLVAAAEAEAAGVPVGGDTWRLLCQMLDVTAATLDIAGHPPRYGDSDDGRGIVLADPAANRWRSLLAVGAALFGPQSWWPSTSPDAMSVLVTGLVGHTIDIGTRPLYRRSYFPDSGLTLLRTPREASEEIWCRCDGGAHGFLSIAAHAHADALSIELRHDGVELLVDPGTYCYHDAPAWRSYFRSTLAHNTLQLDGEDQSVSGGPFLWTHHARTRLVELTFEEHGLQRWSAEHDGYSRLAFPALHRRTVTFDPSDRSLEILDSVISDGEHALHLAFHLGPTVEAAVDGSSAVLCWQRPGGGTASATLNLPGELAWNTYRGSSDPPCGWYSSRFGRKCPTITLIGAGRASSTVLRSGLRFDP